MNNLVFIRPFIFGINFIAGNPTARAKVDIFNILPETGALQNESQLYMKFPKQTPIE